MIGDSLDADVQRSLRRRIDAIFLMKVTQVANHIKQVNHLLELNIYKMKRHS
jgi:predicted HAD superfamily phosphohydrolase YqeG